MTCNEVHYETTWYLLVILNATCNLHALRNLEPKITTLAQTFSALSFSSEVRLGVIILREGQHATPDTLCKNPKVSQARAAEV